MNSANMTGLYMTWLLTVLNAILGFTTMNTTPDLAITFFIGAFISLILFWTCLFNRG
jgi:heme A synthase